MATKAIIVNVLVVFIKLHLPPIYETIADMYSSIFLLQHTIKLINLLNYFIFFYYHEEENIIERKREHFWVLLVRAYTCLYCGPLYSTFPLLPFDVLSKILESLQTITSVSDFILFINLKWVKLTKKAQTEYKLITNIKVYDIIYQI